MEKNRKEMKLMMMKEERREENGKRNLCCLRHKEYHRVRVCGHQRHPSSSRFPFP
jgi:hypothetical protein